MSPLERSLGHWDHVQPAWGCEFQSWNMDGWACVVELRWVGLVPEGGCRGARVFMGVLVSGCRG